MNDVSMNIRRVTAWVKDNPNVVEPNMAELMSLLCDASQQSGKKREGSMEAYSELYAARFGDVRCPDRSSTAMWQLYRSVANRVIMSGYNVCSVEKELLVLLMSVGNFVAQGNQWDNPYEENRIDELYTSYSGEFTDKVKAAYEEIKAAKVEQPA